MSSHLKGILLIVMGTVSWGASGVISQFLFTQKNFLPLEIVPIRCLFASFILLAIDSALHKGDIFSIWKTKDAFTLIIFGILGMVGIQYTFFQTIYYSNAATATILQYLMPIVIVFYMIYSTRKLPRYKDIIAVILAMLGTFLLITKGQLTTLSISKTALFWGLVCAVVAAFYTLQPRRLIHKWRATLIIGWGMFIGGFLLTLYSPFWNQGIVYDMESIIALTLITVVGTALAFYGYLESTQYLTPTEISVFASLEPFSSIILSFIFLGTHFGFFEITGALIIIVSITMLSH